MVENKVVSSTLVVVTILQLLLVPSALFAAEYYVDGVNGSDENDGSLDFPWQTIYYAISNGQASGTDTIYLKYAIYNESLILGYDNTSPALNFIGIAEDGKMPVIAGDGRRHIVALKNFNGILQGLEVTGAQGHGIDIGGESNSAKVLECKIHGNGKGIHVNNTSTPLIAKNKIYGNSECGVATMLESSATVDGNEIYENGNGSPYGSSAGICIPHDSTSKIINNIIRNNYNTGIIVLDNSSPEIVNNTFAHHRGDQASPGIAIKVVHRIQDAPITYLKIANNIIYDSEFGLFSQGKKSIVGNAFNNFWQVDEEYFGFAAGNSEISTDPLFVSNYSLSSESLCIDAGTTSGAPATDINGVYRPLGEGVDMGAYERYPVNESSGGQNPSDMQGFSPALFLLL